MPFPSTSSHLAYGASALALSLLAAPLSAQAPNLRNGPSTIEFSFSNPGARSMGFGGAFASLADDATAAYANPAGLTQIVRPEVSIEGRLWSYSTPYVAGGRATGSPTGIGLDTFAGLREEVDEADVSELAFTSFVYPLDHWAFAVYRHQLASFEVSSGVDGLFANPTPTFPSPRLEDARTETSFAIVSLSFAAAWEATDDLSLGFGLSRFRGDLDLRSRTYLPPDPFGPGTFTPETMLTDVRFQIDGEEDWGWSAGFLWKIDRRWRLGGFFRQGPELEASFSFVPGAAFPFPIPAVESTAPTRFPDVFGLGVSWRSPSEKLTLSAEWDRVDVTPITLEGALGEVLLADSNELHLGGEYVFVDANPIFAIRAGVWHDPAQRVFSSDDSSIDQAVRPAEDELHVALGIGWVFRDFQIDVGADFSELVDSFSISAVYSF